jgi:hypothetical protein
MGLISEIRRLNSEDASNHVNESKFVRENL